MGNKKKQVIPVEEGDEQQQAVAQRERIRRLYVKYKPPSVSGVAQDKSQIRPQADTDPPAKANTKPLFGGW